MPTVTEFALQWAGELSAARGADVAIAFRGIAPPQYATALSALPYHHGTAAVVLLQALPVQFNRWLALSYVPTAACIGMASFLGITRMVWMEGGQIRGATLSREDGPTFLSSADANAFLTPPGFPTNRPDQHVVPLPPGQGLGDIFQPADGTETFIQELTHADDTAKDSACLLLSLAIAARGHGSNRGNIRRSANFQGQNIASVLVDRNYRILRWSLNNNTIHSSFHGETNAIRSYQTAQAGSLPAGGKLFTTLEPCAMCSGMIVHTAGPSAFEVVSAQTDHKVGYSALRPAGGSGTVDGPTQNHRQVTPLIGRTPLHLKVRHVEGTFDELLSGLQRQQTVPGGDLLQTTLFLEQHAEPVMEDAAQILDKMATVWLDESERPAWRVNKNFFLRDVERAISGRPVAPRP